MPGRYQAPCHEVGDDPRVSSGPVRGELLSEGLGHVGPGDPCVSSGSVLVELLMAVASARALPGASSLQGDSVLADSALFLSS